MKSQLPREVENHIRSLRNNDALVSEVASLLLSYKEIRGLEVEQPTRKELRNAYDRVQTTLVTHIQAIHAIPEGFGIRLQSQFLDELQNMREQWDSQMPDLNKIEGRTTFQNSLDWITDNLVRVFSTWAISDRKLSGFLKSTLPIISPDNCPSPSKIDHAVSEFRN